MSNGIRSNKVDYQYAAEGVGFADQVLKHREVELLDLLKGLNNPEVMGGETGLEYSKKLQAAGNVTSAVIAKYGKFSDKIVEVCAQNGAFLEQTVMDDFDTVMKKFNAKADDVSKFNGRPKAAL